MKRLIAILFITLFIEGFSQVRVPDTETFSLQNVWDAVKDHAPLTDDDLQACFDSAEVSYFNQEYDYYPINSMKRFRDYGPIIPEFMVVMDDGFWYVPALLDSVGRLVKNTTYHVNTQTWKSDYDPNNKVMVYLDMSDRLVIVDGSDLLDLSSIRNVSDYYTDVSRAGNYWFAGIDNSSYGKYNLIGDYSQINLSSSIFLPYMISPFPPTSGEMWKVIYYDPSGTGGVYYYTTNAGEIGTFPYPGVSSSLVQELHDSDTHDFYRMTYQKGIFLALGSTRRSRYSTNLSSWQNFIVDSDPADINILRAYPYGSDYSIAVSATGKVYRISHTNPPVSIDITPAGYTVSGLTVSGGYAYISTYYSIFRAPVGSTSWSVYITGIPNKILELWKY